MTVQDRISNVRHAARVLEGTGDWQAVARLAAEWQALMPAEKAPYFLQIRAWRALGDLVRAAGSAAAALQKFPADQEIFGLHAELVAAQGGLPAPETGLLEDPAGLAHLAAARRAQGDAAGVEQIAGAALQRFPDHQALLAEGAWAAMMRQDWPTAVARAAQAVPPLPPATQAGAALAASLAQRLCEANHADQAEAFLAAALPSLPPDRMLFQIYGACARSRRDWPETERRWSLARAQYPNDAGFLGSLAEAVIAQQNHLLGRELVMELLRLAPTDVTAAILYARLELRAGRYAEALRQLEETTKHHPGQKQLAHALNDARYAAMLDMPAVEQAADPGGPELPATAADDKAGMKQMFLQFESLGSNCEFGLLQRHFGAEPLGLLRWAAIPPAGLCELLENRFNGIDDPAVTRLITSGNTYVLLNDKYGYGSNTFVPTSAETPETLLPKLLSRMDYLARKLSKSLTKGDKLFVYKAMQGITSAETTRLQRALRSYGPAALLVVECATSPVQYGTIEHLDDGLMRGYLDQFSNVEPSVAHWLKLCTAAYSAWQKP